MHFCTMRAVNAIGSGIEGFFGAFNFIRRNRMGWMFLAPVLLWVLLTFVFIALLQGPVDTLLDRLSDRLRIELPTEDEGLWHDVLAFIDGARDFLLVIVLKLAVAYLLFIANKYIVLILLSPLLAYASERTEEILTGREFPFSWAQLLKDALRGSLIAIRNGLLELFISIVIWAITFFVPIAAPVSLVLLFFVSAYFYGFSMFDYVFERRRMRVGDSVRAVNDRIALVFTNGALFSLLMKIPLIGIMFAPVMAAVGAVLALKNDPVLQQPAIDHER